MFMEKCFKNAVLVFIVAIKLCVLIFRSKLAVSLWLCIFCPQSVVLLSITLLWIFFSWNCFWTISGKWISYYFWKTHLTLGQFHAVAVWIKAFSSGFSCSSHVLHFHCVCFCPFHKSWKDWTGQKFFVLCLGVGSFNQVISMLLWSVTTD